MPPRALRWLTPLFMAAAAVAVNGYAFGTTDQSIHLTFLRALTSPGAMAGDLVADHAAAHPSLWWWLQVPVVQALGWERLPALYLGAWLLALGATFLLLHRLAEALHGRTWLALLAPALLVPFRLCPGHVHTFEPELINRTLAEPLLLGALLLGLRGRLVRAALLAGLAADLHATTGVHLAVGLAGLALADPALRRRLPAAGFVFFAAAAPLVVLLARRGAGPLWVDPDWWRVLAWRMPHHLMPTRWPAGYWALAVVEVALFALGARALADPGYHPGFGQSPRFRPCRYADFSGRDQAPRAAHQAEKRWGRARVAPDQGGKNLSSGGAEPPAYPKKGARSSLRPWPRRGS